MLGSVSFSWLSTLAFGLTTDTGTTYLGETGSTFFTSLAGDSGFGLGLISLWVATIGVSPLFLSTGWADFVVFADAIAGDVSFSQGVQSFTGMVLTLAITGAVLF